MRACSPFIPFKIRISSLGQRTEYLDSFSPSPPHVPNCKFHCMLYLSLPPDSTIKNSHTEHSLYLLRKYEKTWPTVYVVLPNSSRVQYREHRGFLFLSNGQFLVCLLAYLTDPTTLITDPFSLGQLGSLEIVTYLLCQNFWYVTHFVRV